MVWGKNLLLSHESERKQRSMAAVNTVDLAEALALGPPWRHLCYVMLYAPNPKKLFGGRIPLRYSVLVRNNCSLP